VVSAQKRIGIFNRDSTFGELQLSFGNTAPPNSFTISQISFSNPGKLEIMSLKYYDIVIK